MYNRECNSSFKLKTQGSHLKYIIIGVYDVEVNNSSPTKVDLINCSSAKKLYDFKSESTSESNKSTKFQTL